MTDNQLPLWREPISFIARGYEVLVDDVDADLSHFKWTPLKQDNKNTIYLVRGCKVDGAQQTIYMHRLIMSRVLGRSLERREYVDHINGNGLDNRRDNLRIGTPSQNSANARINRRNTTGFKGVSRLANGKYRAAISKDNKLKNLGDFNTPEEAHEVYAAAARALAGDFANPHGVVAETPSPLYQAAPRKHQPHPAAAPVLKGARP